MKCITNWGKRIAGRTHTSWNEIHEHLAKPYTELDMRAPPVHHPIVAALALLLAAVVYPMTSAVAEALKLLAGEGVVAISPPFRHGTRRFPI